MEADYVVAAAQALPAGGEVQLLSVDGPDGTLLALPVVRVRGFRRLPVPALSTWVHDYCFLGAPLVRVGHEALAWQVALRHVARRRELPWLLLPDLPADGLVRQGLSTALQSLGMPTAEVGVHLRAAAFRRPDGTVAPSGMRGVHVKGLRRQRRRLGEEVGGPVPSLVECTGEPWAVERFLDLEASGWKGRTGTAMSSRGRDGDLLRCIAEVWPSRVQIFCLQSADRVLAMQVNLRAGSSSFCFKTAFDESVRRWAPGTLLETDILRWFADESSLHLLDSCAVAGHEMAERVLPDRRPLSTVLVPLNAVGHVAAWSTPKLMRAALLVRPLPWRSS